MRTPLLGLFAFAAFPVLAQCPFTPTITPDNAILCPDEQVELSTQAYDSYQWLRGGEPISGATSQTLTVTSMDAGYYYAVTATLDGCTETSEEVLVDGWAFLGPYIISGGDPPYAFGDNGEAMQCVGDTVQFDLGGAEANITWYYNGDVIPGETTTTLIVTTTGNYTATGAPGVCPNYIMNVGVEVPVIFTPPTQPEIVQNGNTLCPFPTGNTTQWYLDGAELSTEECIELEASGAYTVFVDYGDPCQAASAPFVITGVQDAAAPAFSVRPVPAADMVRIAWPSGLAPRGTWQLLDMTGRTVRTGGFSGMNALDVDVRSLAPGKYWFSALDARGWKPVPVAVVR